MVRRAKAPVKKATHHRAAKHKARVKKATHHRARKKK